MTGGHPTAARQPFQSPLQQIPRSARQPGHQHPQIPNAGSSLAPDLETSRLAQDLRRHTYGPRVLPFPHRVEVERGTVQNRTSMVAVPGNRGVHSVFRMRATTSCAIVGVLIAVTAAPAMAGSESSTEPVVSITAEEESLVRSFLSDYDVPISTQDSILETLEAGELPLSSTPGATPVSVESFEKDGMAVELSTYSDGSITALETEMPTEVSSSTASDGDYSPNAITACNVVYQPSAKFYTSCKVHTRTATWSYGFFANFTIYNSGLDKVTRAWAPFLEYTVLHSPVDYQGPGIRYSTENSSRPAEGYYMIMFKMDTLPYAQFWSQVKIRVGGNTYWQA